MIIGALLLIWVGYSTFFKTDTPVNSNTVLVSENAIDDSLQAQSGREILAILLSLKSLNLDTSIFNETAFQSLIDFGQSIPERPRGRDNPFAPIGTNNISAGVSSSIAR